MAGENEDHEDSMEGTDDSDILTDHSDCDDLDAGDMEYYEENEYCSVHQNLKDDIRKALSSYPESEEELGIPSVQIDESRTNLKYISSVVLTFTLKDISDHLLQLWDLEDTPAIIMELDNIHRGEFRTYGQMPTILVKKHSSEGHFIVGEQLKYFALKLCRESFTLRSNGTPEVVGSFFSLVYGQVKERLTRLSEFCVTCGEVLTSGGVLPSICDRDLCMYQYSELHLFDGLSVPRVTPEVLSLLLFAFANANLSQRRKDILTPAPPIRSMVDLLNEAKTKRTEKVGEAGDCKNGSDDMKGTAYWNYTVTNAVNQKSSHAFNSTESATFSVLLENLPCPREFLASVSSYHQFRKDWPIMSDIVDWLVISNRSYLEMVPRPMSVDFLLTEHQYCFVSDTPAKQAEFDQLVMDNGGKTRFFFHGSPLENWHSIIRSGLKNMSGTKYQLVGAAYGKGIYLTPFLDFAIGYASRMGSSIMRKISGDGRMTQDRPIRSDCKRSDCCETERQEDLSCVALVEVVDCPSAYNEKTDEIFVVEEDKWCSIRMLLLYRSSDINKVHSAMDKTWAKDYNMPPGRLMGKARRSAMPSLAGTTSGPGVQAGGGVVYQHAPSTGSQGIMTYMMNKFSNWNNASTGSSTSSQQMGQVMSQVPAAAKKGSRELIAKVAEAKKVNKEAEKVRIKKERDDASNISAAYKKTFMLADNDTRTSESPPTLGTSTSIENAIDITKDDEDKVEEQPGTSGLQNEAKKERVARLKMALGDSDDGASLEDSDDDKLDFTEMSDAFKKRTKAKGNKKKDDTASKMDLQKEKDKEGSKRKRAITDWKSDVPKKTSSSPANDKDDRDDTDLTEEDMKILEMFGNSDIGEEKEGEDDEIKVVGVVHKKENKKKSSKVSKDGENNDDESSDGIEITKLKDEKKMRGKNIYEKNLFQKNKLTLKKEDENEDDTVDVEDVMNYEEDDDSAPGPSNRTRPHKTFTQSFPTPFYPQYPHLSTASTSTSTAPYPSYLTALPSMMHPPPAFLPLSGPPGGPQGGPFSGPPGGPPGDPIANAQQYLSAQHAFMQQQVQAMHQSHQANQLSQQAYQAQHQQIQQQMIAQLQSVASTMNAAANSIPALHNYAANPLSSATGVIPPTGVMPPPGGPGGTGGLFQMVSRGLFPRRRRRGGNSVEGQGGSAAPGDLTEISDAQREQIYQVVRMFRNSGFEDRVNRHINRDEKRGDEGGAGNDE